MKEASSTALEVSSYRNDKNPTQAIETKIKNWRDDSPDVRETDK